jgi:hypothetical protein
MCPTAIGDTECAANAVVEGMFAWPKYGTIEIPLSHKLVGRLIFCQSTVGAGRACAKILEGSPTISTPNSLVHATKLGQQLEDSPMVILVAPLLW